MRTHKGGVAMYQISDYELELMKIIWANDGTALYAEIAAGLEERGNAWTKNTIITLLSRLVEKGVLKTNKIGRKNKYTAVISAEEYQSEQTIQFVDKIYEGNMKNFVSAVIDKGLISPSDYEELLKQWQGGDKENE
jgi:predicted transcriptional regulator